MNINKLYVLSEITHREKLHEAKVGFLSVVFNLRFLLPLRENDRCGTQSR